MNILTKSILVSSLMVFCSIFLWNCEPGESLEVSNSSSNQDTTAAEIHIKFIDWSADFKEDSTFRLELLVVDSETRTEPQADLKVKISAPGDITDSTGNIKSTFTSSNEGVIIIHYTPQQGGEETITARVNDSEGNEIYSRDKIISVAGIIVETVTQTPTVGFNNWPAGAVIDSVTELEIVVQDSATKKVLKNVLVEIFTVPANMGEISDTSGKVISEFISSQDGTIIFNFTGSTAGQVEIKAVISDSSGTALLSEGKTLIVDEVEIVETITKQMTLEVLSPIINADGNTKSDLKVTIKDDANHPLSEVEVNFRSTGGTIVASAITDEEGVALGWIKSDRTNAIVYVTATHVSPDQNLSETQTVVFSGIQLSVTPQTPVTSINKIDSVLISLKDASGREVTNDTVTLRISKGFFADTDLDSMKVVTDAFGQYSTWVKSAVAGDILITASALGAKETALITFNNNTMNISANKSSIPGDGTSKATFTVSLKNGNNQPISGAQIKWSTSFGSFESSPIMVSDASGECKIQMLSPNGSGKAIVSAEAIKDGKIVASGSASITITALTPHKIVLTVSPDNIKVDVGETNLRAVAYDEKGNIINNLLIGFRMLSSSGGGDESFTSPVVYTNNGAASTTFKAGSVISSYQGMKFTAVALDVDGPDTTVLVSGDTASLTISGPPEFISLGANILKGENPNDGTFALPIAAVVTDVNGNLVADGTKVNFSLIPSGYFPYASDALQWWGPVDEVTGHSVYKTFNTWGEGVTWGYLYYTIIEKPLTLNLPWTDYNNNGVLDEGEEGRGGKPMRGEDQNGNGIIDVPPDRYYDLNGNLRRETGDCPSGYPDPEDSTIAADIELRSRIYKLCDYAEPFIGFQAIYYPDDTTRIHRYEPVFVDYTNDGFWNKNETCFDDNNDGLCQVYGDTDSLGFQLYEFNFEGGKVTNEAPLPYGKGGGVVDVVETVDGKAVQKITYPQSDAVKIQVRISAEANGVKDFIKIRLPIIEGN